jgi:hypothetical protein
MAGAPHDRKRILKTQLTIPPEVNNYSFGYGFG